MKRRKRRNPAKTSNPSKGSHSLYLLLGGAGALYLYTKNSNAMASSSSGSFLDALAQGVSDLVTTLTGGKKSFVDAMTPIAQAVQAQYGIDPLITITQAALESGWGASGLTKKANNLYGYTGDAQLNQWLAAQGMSTSTPLSDVASLDLSAAPFILMQTHESSPTHAQYWTRPGDIISQTSNADGSWDLMVWRPFRRYDSWQSSVNDWASLMHESRYAAALADAKAGDLQSFAQDVAAAGYATEPSYADDLIAVGDQVGSSGTA